MTAIGSTTTDRLYSVTVRDDEDHDEQFVLREVLLSMVGKIAEDEEGSAMSIESSPVRTLLVTGLTGTGMTYLSSCAANEFATLYQRLRLEKGLEVSDLDVARVISAVEITALSGKKLLSFLKDLLKCRFLVIDGMLNLAKYSRSTVSAFNDFLVLRHDSKRKTVITSSLDPDVLSEILDQRIKRRLSKRTEARLVLMAGKPFNESRKSRLIATDGDLKYLSACDGHNESGSENS